MTSSHKQVPLLHPYPLLPSAMQLRGFNLTLQVPLLSHLQAIL